MIKRLAKKRGDEGFTLIELLVVIIIIGILAAIAIPVFLNQRKKGWDAAVQADLRNAATAEETVLTNDGVYTTDMSQLVTPGGFKYSPVENYKVASGVTSPTITAVVDAGNGYCLYAQSASETWFWYDSAGGPDEGTAAPTVAQGHCSATTPTP